MKHGLPVWGLSLERVHATRDGTGGGRVTRKVHVHRLPLDEREIVEVDGIRVTSVARTVHDIARSVAFEHAVVVADAALARRLVDGETLRVAQDRAAGWPGGPAARRALAFADGRSESVGESRSRVAFQVAGLPPPVPQWEVRSRDGRLVGRVDFGWPDLWTVGEFDGKVKYGRLLRPGQSPGDVVFDEKRREDDLRAELLSVGRWVWDDLEHFGTTAERLNRAFALAAAVHW